jgi:cytoskeletal protein CcmA (bactofilin family)
MFNAKQSSNPETFSSSITIISNDALIKGDIESVGDIRIDGKLIGNVVCKSKIIIGPKGIVEGDISGNNADIQGAVKGKIKMSGQLNLQGKSIITGDIHASKLQIESTVCFNGNCHMGASIVELNNEHAAAVNE